MTRLFVGNRKRRLIEVFQPKQWEGKFVIFDLNGEPLFVSVLLDWENEDDPMQYDHGLCQYAARVTAGLSPVSHVSFGGGSCGLAGGELSFWGMSGDYGKYSRTIILQMTSELLEAFDASNIKVD